MADAGPNIGSRVGRGVKALKKLATSGITVAVTAITGGANTKILFDNAGIVGEYTISGTGNVAMTTSPVFTTPALGAATGTSVFLGSRTGQMNPNDAFSAGFANFGLFSLQATSANGDVGFAFTQALGSGAAGQGFMVNGIVGTHTDNNYGLDTANSGLNSGDYVIQTFFSGNFQTVLWVPVGTSTLHVPNGAVLNTPTTLVLTNATGLPAASVVSGALVNGMTATTQAASDNSTKLATTAYVDRVVSITGPTTQTFTSGSGTYTTAAGVKWIKVRMIGGGGGGGAPGNGTPGTSGGDTTFSTLTAHGGLGGLVNAGGVGGAASGGNIVNANGGDGAAPGNLALSATFNGTGGAGGSGCFGGAGFGGANGGSPSAGHANTGGGGGGGAATAALGTHGSGGGGGSGGYEEHIINSPSATYSYGVGGGGAGNSDTTDGTAGAAGGSGYIVVEEHYNA